MMDKDTIAVRCKGVTKTYGTGGTQVHALCGVDLEVMALDPIQLELAPQEAEDWGE